MLQPLEDQICCWRRRSKIDLGFCMDDGAWMEGEET